MRRNLHIAAILVLGLGLVFLTLASCITAPETPAVTYVFMPLNTPEVINAQATADDQAVATAEIVRANAQATLDSANATLSAAQAQQQNSADVVAAQNAAAAAIVRANAQATLYSASSTQSAALAQDAIRQTQTVAQENRNEMAASTQTAVANTVATQTQSALATAQWYTNQSNQRQERGRSLIASLWMWCLPIFIMILAVLVLWGFWRWLKIHQDNQPDTEQPVEKLPAPVEPSNPQERFLPPESDIVDGEYRITKPDDEQMHGWLDEIKRKLLKREKDNDDNPDS